MSATRSPRRSCSTTTRTIAARTTLAATVLVLLGGWSAGPASAAPQPKPQPAKSQPAAPQLSIAVEDGQEAAASGDKLTYTLTVTNLGAKAVRDVWLTQSLPAGATLVEAGREGEERGGQVRWRLDLAAAGKATVQTTMQLGRTAQQELRLATVACAAASAKGPPVVCASDSNLLPAGKEAERQAASAEQQSPTAQVRWWPVAAAAGGLVLLGVAAGVLIRLRRRGPSSAI